MACLSLAFNIKKHEDKTITAELERVEKEILDKGWRLGEGNVLIFLGQENQQKSVETDDFEQKSLKILGILKKEMKIMDNQLIWQNCQKFPSLKLRRICILYAHWLLKPQEETGCFQKNAVFPCFLEGQFWFSAFEKLKVYQGSKKDLSLFR